MRSILFAAALAGLAAAPALAVDDMTCADFTALDAAGQTETLSMMEGGMASGGMMASTMTEDAMAPEEMATAVAAACAENPDMMLGEALDDAMMHE